jgi:hypothetical protein
VSKRWTELPIPQLGTYNCWDTYTTALLWDAVETELEENGQAEFFHREYWPLVRAAMRMQARGILVDPAAMRAYAEGVTAELEQCNSYVQEFYAATRSTTDVRAFLVDRMKEIFWGRRGRGRRKRVAFTKAELKWLSDRQRLNIDSGPQLAKWLFQDLE